MEKPKAVRVHASITPETLTLLDVLAARLTDKTGLIFNRSDAVAYAIHLTAKKEGLL